MKKLFSFLLLSIVFIGAAQAQKITGLWYSADSSRVYEIKQAGDNTLTATIRSSERKTDSIGYTVIKNLTYNNHKKRYEGVIYAVSDGQPAFVKITFDKHNTNKLILKLNKLFLFNVDIDWVRDEAYTLQ